MTSIVVRGHRYPVGIEEIQTRTPDTPTKKELEAIERRPWERLPQYDYRSTWELSVFVPSYYAPDGAVRRVRWSDRKRWRLEDKLGHVLQEIQQRADLDDLRQREKERGERARHSAHETALRQAWERLVIDHRARLLRGNVKAFRLARDIRALCEAIRSGSGNQYAALTESAEAWLSWAEDYADGTDPRLHLPLMPPDPHPSPQLLQPYLGQWDPYLDEWDRWGDYRSQFLVWLKDRNRTSAN